MRKILFIFIILGLLLISSYSTAGLVEKKNDGMLNNVIIESDNPKGDGEYIPTYCIADIRVYPPWGRMEIRLNGQYLNISNWTGTNHQMKIEWTVNNTYGNLSDRPNVIIHTRIREWMYYTDFSWFLFIFTNSGSICTPNNPEWFIMNQIPIRKGQYSGEEIIDVLTPDTGSGYIQISSYNWYFDLQVNPIFNDEWNDGDLYL